MDRCLSWGRGAASVLLLAGGILLAPAPAAAAPTMVEQGWSVIRTIAFAKAQSARFSLKDKKILVGRRGSGADGLYSIDSLGLESLLASGSNVAAVMVTENGDAYFSEDYGGVIYKVAYQKSGRTSWGYGFHAGDDDPVGMALAPKNHVGPVLKPGEALVVDRGSGGPDEIWKWSPTTAGMVSVVHQDNGLLTDPVDLAISSGLIYVVDAGPSPGRIYTVGSGGSLAQLTTTGKSLGTPVGITLDPKTGDLLVVDAKGGKVLRVDDFSGVVTEVVTGLVFPGDGWASIDHSADGRRLLVTAKDTIYVLARCAVAAGDAGDCDNNGKLDACDLAAGTHKDCNDNGTLDVCDIASATSTDCDKDKVPDECPVCAPVETVFIMDTSSSMTDEASALCAKIKAIPTILKGKGITISATALGISETGGSTFSCLTDTVVKTLGTTVPGNPPATVATLGKCPGGSQVASEDWGRATAVVAGVKKWGAGNVRLVIPISDEGPWCGDPVSDPGVDRDSITQAIKVAVANKVMVSPITGTGSSAAVVKLATELATGTGGKTISSQKPQDDMVKSVLEIIKTACKKVSDCNKNGTPDACDVSSKKSKDCDFDGVPDECQSPQPVCAAPDAGVPDASPPDAGVPDLTVPDLALPDLALPDLALPDAPAPDAKDTPPPDVTVPDAALPDLVASDMAAPDLPAPDTKDTPPADVAAPDVALPDAGAPDAPAVTPDTTSDHASFADAAGKTDGPAEDSGGCDCSTVPGAQPQALWMLALAMLLLRRRRR